MSTIPAGQYRVEQVQILDWGGYCGLQVLKAGRTSTAILGPSGRGKSTLLDAMASVIMPNPQEFNQAARDDKGRRRERTVYSYARGQTVSHQDDNGRSSTPSYLRPPGGRGFISGAAITWSTGEGKRVTAFRVAWIASDAADNAAIASSTVYGFVHDFFDLACLDGLEPARAGSAPVSEASMRHLIDPGRGDVVDHRQSRMHAAMRRTLQMGSTEESQQLAMQLLRRAQASKGIFSINDLFKEFVLTEPRALARWDITLGHYRDASRLYDEFELARTKTETLAGLPGDAEQYRAAGQAAVGMRALAQLPDSGVARLKIWHAGKVLEWADTYEEEVHLDLAQAKDDLREAQKLQEKAERAESKALTALTSSGQDQTALIRHQIEEAEKEQKAIETGRAAMASRLQVFDQVLPSSSGDLELLRAALDQLKTRHAKQLGELSKDHEKKAGEKTRLAEAIPKARKELERVSNQPGNIPHDADQRRQLIAKGTEVPVERLQYIGELLDIPPEYQGWERAIVTIIRPLASDLLVDSDDFPEVRAWVNSHELPGDITLVPGVAHRPARTHPAGTVAAMLDITDGPYSGWISEQLERFTYLCVERDTDLDGPRPHDVIGRVTRAGMRTAPNGRVTKTAPLRYRWIGRDNSALLADLKNELEGLRQQFDDAGRKTGIASDLVRDQQGRINELDRLQNELSWEALDLEPVKQRLSSLANDLTRADNPEQRARREDYDKARRALSKAEKTAEGHQENVDQLNQLWAAVQHLQDEANKLVDASEPLTADELAISAPLPFKAPGLNKAELSDRNVDAKADAAVRDSYADAKRSIEDQIQARDAARTTYERTLLATIRAYRNINDRTSAEIDDDLGSLPALESIYQQLVTDDLPRARASWLAKVDAELNQGLRTLLEQIDTDRKEITRGLRPINTVLARVPFRDGSYLAIEPADRPNASFKEFRDVIKAFTRDNPLGGVDLFTDEAKIEASFKKLRKRLEHLTDPSRAGESWRRNVFDAREHVAFHAIETPGSGQAIVHEGVSGMSGGEGQELIAFILGAALRYRLGEGGHTPPVYGCVVLDEGFVKADSDYTGRALRALQELGFQLIVGAPREKATAFEDFVDLVAYISSDPDNPDGVRIYSMTLQEALQLDQNAA